MPYLKEIDNEINSLLGKIAEGDISEKSQPSTEEEKFFEEKCKSLRNCAKTLVKIGKSYQKD